MKKKKEKRENTKDINNKPIEPPTVLNDKTFEDNSSEDIPDNYYFPISESSKIFVNSEADDKLEKENSSSQNHSSPSDQDVQSEEQHSISLDVFEETDAKIKPPGCNENMSSASTDCEDDTNITGFECDDQVEEYIFSSLLVEMATL